MPRGYVAAGFLLPGGFSWQTFTEGTFFIERTVPENLLTIMRTIALVFAAYVGYEVIAHDAEEAQDPSRNIPRAILISVTLCMVIYVTVALVTLGTVPWQQLAGSETALSDAVVHFAPGWGVPMMGSRGHHRHADLGERRHAERHARGVHGGARGDVAASLFLAQPLPHALGGGALHGGHQWPRGCRGSGGLSELCDQRGLLVRVVLLQPGHDSSPQDAPDMPRPFKAPLFPLTPIIAVASCFLIIINTSAVALRFGAGVLATVAVFYYAYRPIARMVTEHAQKLEATRDRIVVPVAKPASAQRPGHAWRRLLAEASEDTSICLLSVVPEGDEPAPARCPDRPSLRADLRRRALIKRFADEVTVDYPQHYFKVRTARTVAAGNPGRGNGNVKLVLMGWPGPLTAGQNSPAIRSSRCCSTHARTSPCCWIAGWTMWTAFWCLWEAVFTRAWRSVWRMRSASSTMRQITALRVICEACDAEQMEDYMLQLRESIEDSHRPRAAAVRHPRGACRRRSGRRA